MDSSTYSWLSVSAFSLICVFYIAMLCLGVFLFIFWIWMLIDVLQRDDNEFGTTSGKDAKLLWALILLFTNGIGTIIYYFMVYRKYPRRKK